MNKCAFCVRYCVYSLGTVEQLGLNPGVLMAGLRQASGLQHTLLFAIPPSSLHQMNFFFSSELPFDLHRRLVKECFDVCLDVILQLFYIVLSYLKSWCFIISQVCIASSAKSLRIRAILISLFIYFNINLFILIGG